MSTELQNNFNGGQISKRFSARLDLEQYKKSCASLRNFYVLPGGGVERRQGSRYLTEATSENSRLIPFDFSRGESYIIEIEETKIRVFSTDPTPAFEISTDIPWTNAEIKDIKFEQVGDVIFLACGTVPLYSLSRTSFDPVEFTLAEVDYAFPPLMEMNTDYTNEMQVRLNAGNYILETTKPTFVPEDVGTIIMMSPDRSPLSVGENLDDGESTLTLDASYSNWKFTTGKTWQGKVVIQRSVDGSPWDDYIVIGDTTNTAESNFAYTSTAKEGRNVELRVNYTKEVDGLDYNLTALSPSQDSLFRITKYYTDDYVHSEPLTYVGQFEAYTWRWSKGAFSEVNGYPSVIARHENRICLGGTVAEPSTIYMSEIDNYFTFRLDELDTSALKVIPITNEPASWLLSKGALMLGTNGSLVTIESADRKLLTPANLAAKESDSFGGSEIQGIKTNETAVYIQAGNQKLRETFYSYESQGYLSRDLTILSDDIAGGAGFEELILQKIPDQIIWGLRGDGKLAALTYERTQDVAGWSIQELGGEVKSIAKRSNINEDEIWFVIKRDGGTYLEYLGDRATQDWFVDSGIKTQLLPEVTVTSFVINSLNQLVVTHADHGLSDGDSIRFTNIVGCDFLNNTVFTVVDKTLDTFIVKDTFGNYIDMSLIFTPSSVTVTGSGISAVNNTYTLSVVDDENYYIYNDISDRIKIKPEFLPPFPSQTEGWVVQAFLIGDYPSTVYHSIADTGSLPPPSGWTPSIAITYNFNDIISGDYIQVSNTWSGLDHLEGLEVQIQGDGSFSGEETVATGAVESDTYYNSTTIGLRYLSTLQPMVFESTQFISSREYKSILDALFRFYNTFGCYAGIVIQQGDREPEIDFDELNDQFPNLSKSEYEMYPINFRQYSDTMGEPIEAFSGDKLVQFNNTYSRLKSLFIIGDIPMPLTILSMGATLSIGGSK